MVIKIPKYEYHVLRTSAFTNALVEFEESDLGKSFSELVNDRRYRLTQEGLSYRMINHWEREGLLVNARAEGKGWRKFSIIDQLWVAIIKELRDFNFSIKQIRAVKNYLRRTEDDTKEGWGLLEFYLSRVLVLKMPVYLIVLENGEASPVLYEEYIKSMAFNSSFPNHIRININELLVKLFPGKVERPDQTIPQTLNPKELEILFTIRFDDWESITVKRRNGVIDMLEITSMENASSKIVDIFKKGDYQDIEIKRGNGKVQCIRRTEKKKL